jgi:hypothetical protein
VAAGVRAQRRRAGLTARQVNLALEGLVVLALVTGLTSWAVGTEWSRAFTLVHGTVGFTLLVLAPAKARGSVRTGLKRGRSTRWLSLGFAVLVLATIGLGVLHATGLWFGVGYWAPLWTHFLFAFLVLPLFAWHVTSRPSWPRAVDLDRRALLATGGAVAVAAVAYGAQEILVREAGLAGGRRRFTGSHEVGSFAPDAMPTVSWIDDQAPDDTAADGWSLIVAGATVDVADLRRRAEPIEATLDCTGGWWSTQSWDGVPLAALLDTTGGRSIKVTSATGFARRFPLTDADHVYLAVGYGGEPLRRGHGAPVRLVAPGRRGPWWVKWVTSVEVDDVPWWAQFPFPLT